jgi:hypothetical protein
VKMQGDEQIDQRGFRFVGILVPMSKASGCVLCMYVCVYACLRICAYPYGYVHEDLYVVYACVPKPYIRM